MGTLIDTDKLIGELDISDNRLSKTVREACDVYNGVSLAAMEHKESGDGDRDDELIDYLYVLFDEE
jgi:hypothetical protein